MEHNQALKPEGGFFNFHTENRLLYRVSKKTAKAHSYNQLLSHLLERSDLVAY